MPIKASDLHVIGVVSNPRRYQSRTRLAKEWLQRMSTSGATIWLVEATFGERDAEVADVNNPHHLIVRCDHELWLKEALINKGVRNLPPDWTFTMWCDADVEFTRENWAEEVVHGLQHYATLQPFSHCVDMGPAKEVITTHSGFGYMYNQGLPFTPGQGTFWHCGFAWAYRRSAFDALGGLIDRAILGAADHHMAAALIGHGEWTAPGDINPAYMQMIKDWQSRADKLQYDMGHIPGTILHHYHGKKENRQYVERWEILRRNDFNPNTDISLDWQGLPQLNGNKPKLRDDLRRYFLDRKEDS